MGAGSKCNFFGNIHKSDKASKFQCDFVISDGFSSNFDLEKLRFFSINSCCIFHQAKFLNFCNNSIEHHFYRMYDDWQNVIFLYIAIAELYQMFNE